jgi:Ca2+-binding RTX toxin-like protein
MSGGVGNDTYVVDVAADQTVEVDVTAAGGVDTVRSAVARTLGAGLENLTLTGVNAINGTGNAAGNVLVGNGSANLLSGLGGADTLRGGGGADTLNGGTGGDVFDFDSVADSPFTAPDVIDGFDGAGVAAGDRIDLSGIDANELLAGNQAFVFGSSATGGVRFINGTIDTFLRANTDGDADFELSIRIIDGAVLASAYSADDLVL